MISKVSFQRDLELVCLVETTKEELAIESPDLNRPGMQFCGFYEHFAWERPQIIGIMEMAYLKQQEPENRMTVLKKYFDYALPCIVICRNLVPPPELLSLAGAADIPVYQTEMQTSRFTAHTIQYMGLGFCFPERAVSERAKPHSNWSSADICWLLMTQWISAALRKTD